ncbi:MAG: hypothetical protein IKD89_08015 [Clostridia bacterium]|nr:hypothetical protein [Clostridia bacterium]
MKILSVDVFDLYGDGTLVFKTNVDTPEDKSVQYAWYVKKGDRTIYKGAYGMKPFMAYEIKEPGNYLIKAYALNDSIGQKDKYELFFTADRETSPMLFASKKKGAPAPAPAAVSPHTGRPPKVTHVAGHFWHAAVSGEYPVGSKFAWYIYLNGSTTPLERFSYSEDTECVCRLAEPGSYQVKLSVVSGKKKETSLSEKFTVTA